jgi:hypothetical protein
LPPRAARRATSELQNGAQRPGEVVARPVSGPLRSPADEAVGPDQHRAVGLDSVERLEAAGGACRSPVSPTLSTSIGTGPAARSEAARQAAASDPVSNRKPRSPVEIGYGLGIFKLDNLLGHNGAALGYSTAMFYLPSKRATIVVWGNNSTNSTTPTITIAFDLAEILFPNAVNQGEIHGTTVRR